MATLDSDVGFEDMLRRTAEIIEASTAEIKKAERKREWRLGFDPVLLAIAGGVGIAAAVTLATGYSALISDTPGIWIHRLMALVIVQSMLVAAIAIKMSARIEEGSVSQRVAVSAPPTADSGETVPSPKIEPDLASLQQVAPRKITASGTLAGRQYLQHLDGTIEIDTLVGRRRFVSIEAAKEFVGN